MFLFWLSNLSMGGGPGPLVDLVSFVVSWKATVIAEITISEVDPTKATVIPSGTIADIDPQGATVIQ